MKTVPHQWIRTQSGHYKCPEGFIWCKSSCKEWNWENIPFGQDFEANQPNLPWKNIQYVDQNSCSYFSKFCNTIPDSEVAYKTWIFLFVQLDTKVPSILAQALRSIVGESCKQIYSIRLPFNFLIGVVTGQNSLITEYLWNWQRPEVGWWIHSLRGMWWN